MEEGKYAVRLSDYCCKLLIIEVFTERGIATASESRFNIPTHIRRSNPRWEKLYVLRLRSKNWDAPHAARHNRFERLAPASLGICEGRRLTTRGCAAHWPSGRLPS